MDGRQELPRVAVELALWLGLALVAFALTFEFADEVGTYAWGAASWPRAVIALLALGALAQFAIRLRERGRRVSRAAPPPDEDPAQQTTTRARRAASLALPLVYVALLPHSGFYVTTPLFLAAYLLLLGERRIAVLIGAPLVIFALINLVFTKLFYVALPTGNWPGFYDVSNWFLVTVR